MVSKYSEILLSLKQEGNLAYVTTWVNSRDSTLCEKRQLQEDKYCMKPSETESRMVVARGQGGGHGAFGFVGTAFGCGTMPESCRRRLATVAQRCEGTLGHRSELGS